MRVRVVIVGKNKSEATTILMEHFIKRISRYCTFQLEVVPESRTEGKSKEQIIARESELIGSKLRKGEFFILLDVEGRSMSSVEFSKKMEDLALRGISNLVFVIGGAYGVSRELVQQADIRLSMSKMTMSHQLVRVVFLEQLYRAFTILRNEPYHH